MARHIFTVLEGVDGCGKTTVSNELSINLNATLVKTPLPDQELIRHIYDNGKDMMARYLFYLSCVVTASRYISELLCSNDVVCDRYLLSAICYHKAMGVNTDIVDINLLDIILPDFTFCLVTNQQVRKSRLEIRGQEENKKILSGESNFLDIVQLDLSFCADYLIDTTETNAKEAATLIASYILNI